MFPVSVKLCAHSVQLGVRLIAYGAAAPGSRACPATEDTQQQRDAAACRTSLIRLLLPVALAAT